MREHTTKEKINMKQIKHVFQLKHGCGAHYHRISIGQEISAIEKKIAMHMN